ncbi:septum formation family protein [Gulosibacter chungangensis]|uniref:Septum formation-related domain-containing protein n=1 Tax=Gulosibacter chungangensis TaxID=979746 RepID=A0A7J5BBL0_9MICO|nr:septum formation family protein [Gulosibacter chungangensis]KAB1643530.1 hypothetical protein F8O05_06495 [Gulosibacter chungangensis]
MKKSLLALALLPGLALLSGCAAPADEAEPIAIFHTEVGQCLNPDQDQTAAFIVPCDQPHLFEVTAVHPIEVADYPGDETIQTLVDETCPDAFFDYTGQAAAASTEWGSVAFAPRGSDWEEQDQRNIVCAVTSLDGEPASGSAKE